jgi:hypothetical protein
MTKRKQTPLQKYYAQLDAVTRKERTKLERDAELTLRVEQDLDLSPAQRLDIFKRLQAWPRIVLGLYRAELAIAQKKKHAAGPEEYGDEKPSDTACRVIGEVLGLGPDRVHDLCAEGRQHESEGWPPKPRKSAAYFVAEKLRGSATGTVTDKQTPKIRGGTVFAPKRHPGKSART